MRIEKEKVFAPITMVLERQEEVDVLYALANFAWLRDALFREDLPASVLSDLYRWLKDYYTEGFMPFHNALTRRLKLVE